ncbi:MAG: NAD-dependent epimerase [Gammaproteobacteria bacterium]|nr:NAD-dependent epimerase [Gammaproteobacteria bacterium]
MQVEPENPHYKLNRGLAGRDVIRILVTGVAGFIGYHTAHRLLQLGKEVVGIDNLNPYYSVALKKDRLSQLTPFPNFSFVELDLREKVKTLELFQKFNFDSVIHLAAQAGVRYSLENPFVYVDSNVVGFLNILEGCRHSNVKHLVYASSSSVYGLNQKKPFSVSHNVDHPISMYAATKKANELMAHTYSYLYQIPTTGLRFFTVYGPWGRPDMAIFKFTEALLAGKTIDVYNYGKMKRDFTYIDDVVEGILRVCEHIPTPNPSWERSSRVPGKSSAPYRLYNMGNQNPVDLEELIRLLGRALGVEAKKKYLPLQAGDVPETYADCDDLKQEVGFKPTTPISVGIERFVLWYQTYYS